MSALRTGSIKALKFVGGLAATIAGLAAYGFLTAEVMDVMPSNALVHWSASQNTYASPPCMKAKTVEGDYDEGQILDAVQAKALKARPDPACQRAGGFAGASQRVTRGMFERRQESRWDEHGFWRW